MICTQGDCKKEVVVFFHWPGSETKQIGCKEHCQELDRFFKIMGAGKLVFTSLVTGEIMEFKS